MNFSGDDEVSGNPIFSRGAGFDAGTDAPTDIETLDNFKMDPLLDEFDEYIHEHDVMDDENIHEHDVILKETGTPTPATTVYRHKVRSTFSRGKYKNREKEVVDDVIKKQHQSYFQQEGLNCPTPRFFVSKKKADEHDQKADEHNQSPKKKKENKWVDSDNENDIYWYEGEHHIRANTYCILHDLENNARKKRSSNKRPKISNEETSTEETQPRFDLKNRSTLDEEAKEIIKRWIASTKSSRSETALKTDLVDQFWKDVTDYRLLCESHLNAEPNDDYDRYRQCFHEKNLLDSVNSFGNAMLEWHVDDSRNPQVLRSDLPPSSGGNNGGNEDDSANQDGSARNGNGSPGAPRSQGPSFSGSSGNSHLQGTQDANSLDTSSSESDMASDDEFYYHSGSSGRTSFTGSLTQSSGSESLASETITPPEELLSNAAAPIKDAEVNDKAGDTDGKPQVTVESREHLDKDENTAKTGATSNSPPENVWNDQTSTISDTADSTGTVAAHTKPAYSITKKSEHFRGSKSIRSTFSTSTPSTATLSTFRSKDSSATIDSDGHIYHPLLAPHAEEDFGRCLYPLEGSLHASSAVIPPTREEMRVRVESIKASQPGTWPKGSNQRRLLPGDEMSQRSSTSTVTSRGSFCRRASGSSVPGLKMTSPEKSDSQNKEKSNRRFSLTLTNPIGISSPAKMDSSKPKHFVPDDLIMKFASGLSLQEHEEKIQKQQQLCPPEPSKVLKQVPTPSSTPSGNQSDSEELRAILQLQKEILQDHKDKTMSCQKDNGGLSVPRDSSIDSFANQDEALKMALEISYKAAYGKSPSQ